MPLPPAPPPSGPTLASGGGLNGGASRHAPADATKATAAAHRTSAATRLDLRCIHAVFKPRSSTSAVSG
jgi:hypothetical protein